MKLKELAFELVVTAATLDFEAGTCMHILVKYLTKLWNFEILIDFSTFR